MRDRSAARYLLIGVGLLLTAPGEAPAEGLVLRGVTVVDVVDGTLRPGQSVVVEGERITAVGPAGAVEVPEGGEVVEAEGGYLVPGLWDMHVHSVQDEGGDAEAVATADWHLPLFLAHGVTGIRNMNDGTGDVTLELVHEVKRRLVEGDLVGPARLLANGPSLDGDPPLADDPVVVRTAEEARAAVDELANAGVDFVKVYENLSRDAYFAILDRARLRGLPVDGHLPFRIDPEEAAQAGQRTIEHPDGLAAGCAADPDGERQRFARILSGYGALPDSEKFLALFRHSRALYDGRDPAACVAAAEAFVRHGVAVVADVVAYHHVVHAREVLSDAAHGRYVPMAVRRGWEELVDSETYRDFRSILEPIVPLELETIRRYEQAGVTLLAGTDVGVPFQVPGISLHEELLRLVEAGLTPLSALQTATIHPARVLGLADALGTVEAGKLADLVLLDADPLADIRNTRKIRAVVANGRLFRRQDLDRLLAGAEAQEAPTEREEPPDTRPDPRGRQVLHLAVQILRRRWVDRSPSRSAQPLRPVDR